MADLLKDKAVVGDHPLVVQEDEKFDENARKGRIAAETLKKPLTFFEAVEALKLPISMDGEEKKKVKKQSIPSKLDEHTMLQKIDLCGFKHLRFSKAGLQELMSGIINLPCIRAVSLKNNGICDEHEKEIL